MQDASSRRGANRRAAREVSIKGSSVPKPTPVIVANLVKGTSPEDVRLTFDALGRLVYVREHHVPSLGANAVAYEVAFEQRADAQAACKKYHGVLADGRVLQVTMKEARPPRRRRAPPPKEPEVSERFEEEKLPLPVLRQLAQAEAKYLAETERILRNKDAATPSLKDRLGSLPLAERLALAGPRTSAQKRRRTKQRRVQKKAGGMDVD